MLLPQRTTSCCQNGSGTLLRASGSRDHFSSNDLNAEYGSPTNSSTRMPDYISTVRAGLSRLSPVDKRGSGAAKTSRLAHFGLHVDCNGRRTLARGSSSSNRYPSKKEFGKSSSKERTVGRNSDSIAGRVVSNHSENATLLHRGSESALRRDHSGTGSFVPEEHSWSSSENLSPKVPQNAAVSRGSNGRNVQCIEEGEEEYMEVRVPDRSTRSPDQRTVLDRVETRKPVARQPILNIPRSELMKIEELRFSGDLREGDSGPQVLNLQRALFWLGHLPGLSLTGYFGPETTRALKEFHTAHGVPGSGVWGFHSQQALRKHLQPESYQVDSVEKPGMKGPMKISRSRLAESWPLAKCISGKMVQSGHHARQAVQRWCSNTVPELIASISSSSPQAASVSGRVGIILLGIVFVSSIAKLWLTLFGTPQGQPVRRRVMSWRNDVSLRNSTRKALRTPSGRSQGPLKSSENEGYMRRPRNRTVSSHLDQQEENSNLVDRLVLFDGQVLRGDGPSNAKILPSMSSGLDILAQNGVDENSRSALWNRVSHMSRMEPYQSGLELDQGKAVHGFDRFVNLEADPPRKYNLLSRSDSSSRLTGREPSRPFSHNPSDSPKPSWSALVGNFFSNMLADKDRNSVQKPAFRRPVRRGNSPIRTKTSERAFTEGKQSLSFDRVERGSMDDSDVGKWPEDDEADLRKRVSDLHRAVEAAEQTRMAAMRALAEERMRSLELEVKVSRQKEAAVSLEEEVRVLKESHDALLASLRKKYSSSAAARAAAVLLYQNWDNSDNNARV